MIATAENVAIYMTVDTEICEFAHGGSQYEAYRYEIYFPPIPAAVELTDEEIRAAAVASGTLKLYDQPGEDIYDAE